MTTKIAEVAAHSTLTAKESGQLLKKYLKQIDEGEFDAAYSQGKGAKGLNSPQFKGIDIIPKISFDLALQLLWQL